MKGSVKPKNTSEAISQCGYPGASDLARPNHKDQADLKMNVDSQKEKYRGNAPAPQRGGHSPKKK